MAKRKKRKQSGVGFFFALLMIVLILTLVITAIGFTSSSPALWVDIVEFFQAIKDHFTSLWMFYTFGLALMIAYLANSKK